MRAGAIALVFCLVQQSIASTVPRGLDGDGHYNLTFLHTNDVHARLDQFEATGAPCESDHECLGGYARLKSKIDELRRQHPDTVVLNAGDEWQGTMFFSYYNDGRTIADTLNTVGFDAMVLGNHEFDEGEDKLAAYLKMLHFPVLGANVHTTSPKLQAANILPYTIIAKHSLAVIGLTTTETPQVSSPSQRTKFSSPAAALSEQVKAIKAAHPEVKRFVALTHLGYGEDIALAKTSRDVHLIIGGHSHTLLGDMDKARGKYPTVVKNAANQDVLVVTSYRYGEYLGRISVLFNREGQIDKWEGAPILITDDIHPDAALDQKVADWRKPFMRFSQEIVGQVAVTPLSNVCGRQECSLGNLVCDVIVAFRNSGGETAQVDGAFYNAGGIRTPLPKGAISRRDVMNAFPFASAVVEMSLTGQQLWTVFSAMLNKANLAGHAIHSYLQVSSDFEIRFDPTQPAGSRLLSVSIGGNPIVLHKTYSIATNDFIAAGGDFFFPKTPRDASVPAGPNLARVDELVIKYLKKHNPYAPPLVGRRLRDVTKPADLDIESNAQLLAGYDGSGFPVEDGAWTAVAIMAASITFIVLAVEYLRRDSLL